MACQSSIYTVTFSVLTKAAICALFLLCVPLQFAKAQQEYSPSRVKSQSLDAISAQKQDECRFTYPSVLTSHYGLPPMFKNVSAIYLWTSSNGFEHLGTATKFVQPGSLAVLSACTIEKDTNGRIPVVLPQLSSDPRHSFFNYPDANKHGILVVRVSMDLQNPLSFRQGVAPGQIVVTKVDFFRSDLIREPNMDQSCATAFVYPTNATTQQKLITDALHLCLDKPFFTAAQ